MINRASNSKAFVFFPVWGPELRNQDVGRVGSLWGPLEGIWCRPFSQPVGLLATLGFLGVQTHHCSLCPALPGFSYVCVSDLPLLSLVRKPVFGFKTHPKSRMLLSCESYLNISAKTLFQIRSLSKATGGHVLGESQFNPVQEVQ